ncbi:PAS domain S-box protein [Candidatus Microgenomates bacterium]|nr:PAS domain S-box protein [Candidatus Microgenomates bacterium]
MSKIIDYLNPVARLGKKRSVVVPLVLSFLTYLLSEIFAYYILKNPAQAGAYLVFLSAALVIYLSLRDGIAGGFIATLLTLAYYAYIIYSRDYLGEQFISAIEATVLLGLLYFSISLIIGFLKQKVDGLIERESNEKRRLQSIVQQLPVGVIITDAKGVVVQSNRKMEEILGEKIPLGYAYSKDEALLKSNHSEVTHTNSQPPLMHILNTGKSVLGKEFTVQRNDGKEVFVQISSTAIRNRKGDIFATASIIDDVSEKKETEKRKDDFVNMVSHELKTPLTSMKLYVDLLKNTVNKEDLKSARLIKGLKFQTDRLQKLVIDLLDVSRIQTGKLNFHKEEFLVDALIEETINELQQFAKKIKIIFKTRSGVKIYADRFRIYQVLTNLINNAIKFSPPDSKILVQNQKEGDDLLVSVQDFGAGIAKSQQKKIFERLYQIAEGEQRTFPGFGMGLYISKEIVIRHRGKIWVESEKDVGSTFYFTLPL